MQISQSKPIKQGITRTLLPFINKSSCPEMFCKKGVLRNFTKFIGKPLSQILLLTKLQVQACNFIKKRLWHRCFPMNFVKFLRTPFLTEHIRWLASFYKETVMLENDILHTIVWYSSSTSSPGHFTSQ